MEMLNRPILIAYDGSDFAKSAITQAAEQLANGRRAIVLTVWQRYGAGFMGAPFPPGLTEEIEQDIGGRGSTRSRWWNAATPSGSGSSSRLTSATPAS
jgi:hypothetical protein